MAEVLSSSESNLSSGASSNEVSRDLLAELNNEGAFFLEHGEYSAAIGVLTSALNAAMRDVGCSEFLIPDQDDDDISDTETVVSRSSSHRNSRRHHHEHGKHEKTSRRQHKGKQRRAHENPTAASVLIIHQVITEDNIATVPQCCFVYEKPLRVADRYSLPSFVELSLYVVYNLAVAYHLRVLKRKKKGNTRMLREILRLYKLAHSIQAREEVGLEPTYTLSLLNNLGQIYKALGKDSKADICFNNVLSNIVCMIDHGCISDVDGLNGFLDNVAHIISPVKKCADAA